MRLNVTLETGTSAMPYTRILLLLSLLAAFPPISTDMYLPALPMLQAAWDADLATINLTLVLFFVFFSLALLAYGPVSDSYGRRPLLLGVIVSLAPMLAPVIGGLVLKWLNWRWIFFIQAAWGVLAWIGVLRMPEPLQNKVPATFRQIPGR